MKVRIEFLFLAIIAAIIAKLVYIERVDDYQERLHNACVTLPQPHPDCELHTSQAAGKNRSFEYD